MKARTKRGRWTVVEHSRLGAGRRAAVLVTAAVADTAREAVGGTLAEFFRVRGYAVADPIRVADGPDAGRVLQNLLAPGTLLAPAAQSLRFVFTAGGTGLRPCDAVPEATVQLLDYQTPGIAHALWADAPRRAPALTLSRGAVGVSGQTFVANLPGDPDGVRCALEVLGPLLSHIQEQLEDVHGHGPDDRVRRSGPSTGPTA